MKKCPFNVDKVSVVSTTMIENDKGEPTTQITKQTDKSSLMNCYGEDCMAWEEGKCMLGVWEQPESN